MGRLRKCVHCGKQLPADATNARRFCDPNCRNASRRRVKKALATHGSQTPEHVQEMIQLAFGAKTDDVIREIFREEIRENITQAVKDNVLGAAEVMTHMLPKALHGLKEDLESEDWIVRSRAQALLFKYAMAFASKEDDKPDLGRLTVVHEVNTPDTPLQQKMKELEEQSQEIIDDPTLEDFERDWPICNYCDERKHPDAVYVYSSGANLPPRTICKSCEVRRKIEANGAAEYGLDSDLNRRLYDI